MPSGRLAALVLVIGLAVGLAGNAPARAAGDIVGRWLTQGGRAVVEIGPCDASTCGRIIWMKDPNDPKTGKPWRDHNNPDRALQHRRVMGIATLSAIQPNKKGNWDAVSYDPRNGETHEITIRLLADQRIELKGCGLGGLICRSEVWSPVPPDQTLTDAQVQQ